MSNNLGRTEVASGQNQKEITINDADGRLDAALTVVLPVPVTSTNLFTLTAEQFQTAFFFTVDEDGGTPATADITLTVPSTVRGLFAVINDTAFTVTVEISGQPLTSPTVATTEASLFTSDGTNVRAAGGGGGGGASTWLALTDTPSAFTSQAGKIPQVNSGETALEFLTLSYDVAGFFGGIPPASTILTRFLADRAFNIPAGMTLSQAHAGTGPSATTAFDVQKNGVSVGTVSFASAATTATFVMATQTDFVAGDRLDLISPAALNGITDVSWNIAGRR